MPQTICSSYIAGIKLFFFDTLSSLIEKTFSGKFIGKLYSNVGKQLPAADGNNFLIRNVTLYTLNYSLYCLH